MHFEIRLARQHTNETTKIMLDNECAVFTGKWYNAFAQGQRLMIAVSWGTNPVVHITREVSNPVQPTKVQKNSLLRYHEYELKYIKMRVALLSGHSVYAGALR